MPGRKRAIIIVFKGQGEEEVKQQAFNPFLPSYEYVPDGEPHIFGDRIYLYGSHDRFNGYTFCLNDYVCWSAPIDNLGNWRYEGVIYSRDKDPNGKRNKILYGFAAPDMCRGMDGRYYLFYFMGDGFIKVAVCDEPAGEYQYHGIVRYSDGTPLGKRGEPKMFDPGIFVDDDGRIYLYSGFGLQSNPILLNGEKPSEHGAMVFELEPDMLTIKPESSNVRYIGVKGIREGMGTPYEGHEFLEASSMRKFQGRYYFIYSSYQSHELCWAVSDSPTHGFHYGGVLISNGDIGYEGRKKEDALNYTGNIHGSIIEIRGKYYVFYHRQTNKKQFSRQACAEEIRFENGMFYQAEMTSCGLNEGPLAGKGYYEARIACNLRSKNGTRFYGAFKGIRRKEPFFTQTGKDRENNPEQYIANMRDGARAGFKYFQMENNKEILVNGKGSAKGEMLVYTSETGAPVAKIPLLPTKQLQNFCGRMHGAYGMQKLMFEYRGTGYFDFYGFELK